MGVLSFSTSLRLLSEAGLTGESSEVAFSEDERLDIEGGFLVGLSERLKVMFGSDVGGPLAKAEIVGSEAAFILGVRSGILISFSPVDFLLGGGPRIESP
jgi:hypothetical protein